MIERKHKTKANIRALVSRLPIEIAERELDIVRRKGKWHRTECHAIEIKNSPGPGNVVMLELDSGNVRELVTGFGRKGIKAEDVARRTFRDAKSYLESDFPVGEHLADQLLLPLGLAASQGQTSSFVTGPPSLHCTTHIDILKLFLDIVVEVAEIKPNQFKITIGPNLNSIDEA